MENTPHHNPNDPSESNDVRKFHLNPNLQIPPAWREVYQRDAQAYGDTKEMEGYAKGFIEGFVKTFVKSYATTHARMRANGSPEAYALAYDEAFAEASLIAEKKASIALLLEGVKETFGSPPEELRSRIKKMTNVAVIQHLYRLIIYQRIFSLADLSEVISSYENQ